MSFRVLDCLRIFPGDSNEQTGLRTMTMTRDQTDLVCKLRENIYLKRNCGVNRRFSVVALLFEPFTISTIPAQSTYTAFVPSAIQNYLLW